MKLLCIIRAHAPRIALAAALVATGAPLARAATADAPILKTEPALGCLLGIAPDGCETLLFEKSWQNWARRSTTYCTVEYTHRWVDNCYTGPLETVEYLGTDPAGADVYAVDYLGANQTYVLFPPGPDGRIPRFMIFNSSHNAAPRDWGKIVAPAGPDAMIYTRPQQTDPTG